MKRNSEFNIPESERKIGQLYPILVDERGNIIDGLHRYDHSPKWDRKVVPWVKTRKDFLIARIHANLHRRSVPKKERVKQFRELADILFAEGVQKAKLASTIAELTRFNDDYVRQLLPKRLLDSKYDSSPARESSTLPQPDSLPDAQVSSTTNGLTESLACLRQAVSDWSEDIRNNPERKKSMTQFMKEIVSLDLDKGRLICPHCKKPTSALLWACCKRKFAGGKD